MMFQCFGSGSGIRDGKNPDLESGINIPDNFSEIVLRVKNS
jgi:hypothetical protein